MNDLPSPVPESLQPYMPLMVGIVTALLILILGALLAKWSKHLVIAALRRRKVDESLVRFLGALVRVTILAATIIAVLGQVGIHTTSMIALLGSAGLAIGLALQGNLSHLASGVMLLVFRPFTIGDFIEAGGKAGTVEEIGMFATKLTTPENHRVLVPNAAISSGPITNFTTLGKRRVRLEIGVAYGSDIERVMAILLEVAGSDERVLPDPAPGVMLTGFGASSIDFAVTLWVENPHFWPIQTTVRKAIYERFAAAGVEIPFNQIVVHRA
jgi:small conductance mechanosensitive channel